MSRDLKFKYVYKCRNCGRFIYMKYTLKQIERLHVGFKPVGSLSCTCHQLADLVGRVQYTGLKDKNGVEIYEGDIVNVPYNRIGNIEVTYGGHSTPCGFNIGVYDVQRLEVIGNRFEQEGDE